MSLKKRRLSKQTQTRPRDRRGVQKVREQQHVGGAGRYQAHVQRARTHVPYSSSRGRLVAIVDDHAEIKIKLDSDLYDTHRRGT